MSVGERSLHMVPDWQRLGAQTQWATATAPGGVLQAAGSAAQ